MLKKILSITIISIISFTTSFASDDDLAKKSQNPIGDVISLPFEFGTNDKTDAGTEVNTLIIKPMIPVKIGDYTLINRFIIPVLDVSHNNAMGNGLDLGYVTVPSGSSRTGLGNIQYQSFLTSNNPGDIIWGLGLAAELPTHAGNLGTDKFSIGPSAVILTMPGKWVLGALTQNLWDVAGSGDDNINKFLFQYFINYNIGNGWYLTSTPTITANWEADSGEKWTVPFGGGAGKLHRFGKQPVDFKFQAFSNVEKPTGAADWSAMFTVKFLFPK
jgi:hypothetical protein